MARGGVDRLAWPDATGEEIEGSLSEHEKNTMEVFRLITPGRRLGHLPVTSSYVGGRYYYKLLDSVPEIIRQGVDTLYASLVDTTCNVANIDAGLVPIADRCCLFFAAGNDSENSASRIVQGKYVWAWGHIT